MEDSEDKLRRNLVVFSMAIVAVHWLEIDLNTNDLKVFGMAINVDPTRLWPAILAVLIYCGLRFHFSNARANEYQRAKSDFFAYRNTLAAIAVERAHLDAIYQRNLKAYKAEKPRVTTESINGHTLTKNGPPVRYATGSARFPNIGFTGWRDVYYRILWDHESDEDLDQKYEHGDQQTDNMKIRRDVAMLIHARALALSGLWSRYTLELYFPYFVAAIALDFCLHALGINLPNHWWHR